MEFLSGLGELVRLRDCSLLEVYTGGLDRNGADGEYAYSWRSEIAQGKGISLRGRGVISEGRFPKYIQWSRSIFRQEGHKISN